MRRALDGPAAAPFPAARPPPHGISIAGSPLGIYAQNEIDRSPWREGRYHAGSPGRVAQGESARFTRERSQVRTPPRPSEKAPLSGAFCVEGPITGSGDSAVLAKTLAKTP